jgi:hypothetical protein
MKRVLIEPFIAILLMASASLTSAQSFSTSDLEGTWTIYSISVRAATPPVSWLRGTVAIDASGNALSGVFIAPDGTTVGGTSGSFSVDRRGILSGDFTVGAGNTVTIVDGKLDQSRTQATFVTKVTDGSIELGYSLKTGGTFEDGDLEGTWYGYQTIIDSASGAVFWVFGRIDVDGSGSVTGAFTAPDGATLTVEEGTLGIDSDGILTGNLTLSSGLIAPIAHGRLDQAKTRAIFVSIASDGSQSLCHLVKGGGTFGPTDVVGKWSAYGLVIDPSIPAVYWLSGGFEFDASGSQFAGTYLTPTGQVITATGTATLDVDGMGTTSTATSTGDTSISPSTKLDQGKTSSVSVTASPTTGVLGIWQFMKEIYLTGTYVQQVQTMYIAYYGRPGDPGGVGYWAGRLVEVGGNWITDLVNAFGTSPEYTERFGGLPPEALIDNLYQQLFNRVADPVGGGFYIDLLAGTNASGLNPTLRHSTLAQIALDIANGALNEDRTILENKQSVAQYFTNRIVETGQRYLAEDIVAAVDIMELVTLGNDSVTAGLIAANNFVASALADSDGDGVSDGFDECPGEDDTVDIDRNGVPDCVSPPQLTGVVIDENGLVTNYSNQPVLIYTVRWNVTITTLEYPSGINAVDSIPVNVILQPNEALDAWSLFDSTQLEPIRNPPPGHPVGPMTITKVTGSVLIIHSLGTTKFVVDI